MSGNQNPVPVSFEEVNVGDTLIFITRDGSLGDIERTGTVTRKTDKVVDVYVGGGIGVFYVDSRGRGRNATRGATARLYRNPPKFGNWDDRKVRRIAKES